jgi:hypothetical protein
MTAESVPVVTNREDMMNISKADAIAQLGKWHSARTTVRAIYRSVTGNTVVVGRMSELSPSTVKITGDQCEMLLYFRDTSEYQYSDVREPMTEGQKRGVNKYPIVIDVKFSNGDRLHVSEYFAE